MFTDFFLQNWYLFLALAVVIFLLALDPAKLGGTKKVSALQLPRLLSHQSATLVDLRSEELFKGGHIANSMNLPLDQLKDKLKKLQKHKSNPIVLACQMGTTSNKAVKILKADEFQDIYILDGGIAAWSKENLPLVKK